jgi:hypothetical protein
VLLFAANPFLAADQALTVVALEVMHLAVAGPSSPSSCRPWRAGGRHRDSDEFSVGGRSYRR